MCSSSGRSSSAHQHYGRQCTNVQRCGWQRTNVQHCGRRREVNACCGRQRELSPCCGQQHTNGQRCGQQRTNLQRCGGQRKLRLHWWRESTLWRTHRVMDAGTEKHLIKDVGSGTKMCPTQGVLYDCILILQFLSWCLVCRMHRTQIIIFADDIGNVYGFCKFRLFLIFFFFFRFCLCYSTFQATTGFPRMPFTRCEVVFLAMWFVAHWVKWLAVIAVVANNLFLDFLPFDLTTNAAS